MLKRMSIKKRLFTLVAVTFVLFTLATGVAIFGMSGAKQRFEDFLEKDQALLLAYTGMYAHGLQMGQALRNIQLDPANRKAYANLEKAAGDFGKALEDAGKVAAGDPAQMELLGRIAALRTQQKGIQEQIVSLVAAGDTEGARIRTNQEETPLWREIRQLLLDRIDAVQQRAGESKAQMLAGVARAQWASAAIVLFAMAVGITLALSIAHNVSRSLDKAIGVAKRIASGDLGGEVPNDSPHEIGVLLDSLRTMQEQLRRLIGGITRTSLQVSEAAKTMSRSTGQIAASSQEKSGSTSAVAAAMEEMTASIGQMAQSAHDASLIVRQSETLAGQGEAVMREAAAEMGRIAESVTESAQLIEIGRAHV